MELMFRANQAHTWAACTKKAVHLSKLDKDFYFKDGLGIPVGILAGKLVHNGILDGDDYAAVDDIVAYDRSTKNEKELKSQVQHLVKLGRKYVEENYKVVESRLPLIQTVRVGSGDDPTTVILSGIIDILAETHNGLKVAVDFKVSTRLASDSKMFQMATNAWLLNHQPDKSLHVNQVDAIFLRRGVVKKQMLNVISKPAEEFSQTMDGLIRRAGTVGDEGFATPSYVACATCPLNGEGCNMAAVKSPAN